MKLSFREEASFQKSREKLFGGDENFRQFQDALMDAPRAGDVVQGTGGTRKVRWADERRGMGKRGGIRIIYLYVEAYQTILLLAAYDKNVEDLTPAQKKDIAAAAQTFKDELQAGK